MRSLLKYGTPFLLGTALLSSSLCWATSFPQVALSALKSIAIHDLPSGRTQVILSFTGPTIEPDTQVSPDRKQSTLRFHNLQIEGGQPYLDADSNGVTVAANKNDVDTLVTVTMENPEAYRVIVVGKMVFLTTQ